MSIHWPIFRSLARRPLRLAVTDDARSYKNVHLLAAALHLAAELERTSQARTVGILLPTSGAFPIATLACWMLGRTVVPLNYLLKPDELRFITDDCGCDAIVSVGPMLDFLGEAALPRGPKLIRLDSLNFRSTPEFRWPKPAADDDLGLLLYTSGTSGKPKGVMLTHGNITSNIAQCVAWAEFTSRDVVLGVLPQFHSFGCTVLTLMPLTVGAKAVYTARFVPGKILRLMREHRPTCFIGIPSMYNALLHAKDAQPDDFSSIRYLVSGGEPLPQAVFDGFRERFGVTINEGYGLTETSPVSNWCRPWEFRRGSVGPPLPGIDQRIIDIDSGRTLPPNTDGEVRMRGPNVMRGYYNRPDDTAAAFDHDGLFRTGDIGRFDDDGHLHITGRLKEMLIVGGENVFPREIEEVLNKHSAVKDSGVVGVTDPVRGELPVAFVELADAAPEWSDQLERDLLAWCRQRLAGYKVPREIVRLDTLPRNPTGKVMRRELKRLLATTPAQS